ncbi:MAG TPA: alpha/beta fold hydrolase [Hyphomicrobiaceae bacterium]|nr:alpha/beta fold hydrolase [Hyphomicrobiaceae bacterium]
MADRSITLEGGPLGFLLIHGLGGTPAELRLVAQALNRAGHTVHCCQLAGHCATVNDLRLSVWQEWYASVEAAHDRLSASCKTIVAGGLSMGGLLAIHLAHQRPTGVQGLAIYAPTLVLDGWSVPKLWSYILRWVRPIPGFKSGFMVKERPPYGLKDERIRAIVLQHMQSGDAGVAGVFETPMHSMAQFNAFSAVVRRELPSVRQRALILHPRDDDMASIENSHYLQRNLGGIVELVVLNDSYHMITLDRQRQVVIDHTLALASRLAKLGPEGGAARLVPAARGAAE